MTKSILQTEEWANFKEQQGWKHHKIDDIFVLEKKLFLNKSFLYAPEVVFENVIARSVATKQSIDDRSPFRPPADRDDKFSIFLTKIQNISQNSNPIFFRLEILDEIDDKIIEKLNKNGFIKAFEETQPEFRQIIDITSPEQDILAQMKEKGRYNIRVAKRHGIIIEVKPFTVHGSPQSDINGERLTVNGKHYIDEFYRLFFETAKRDGFKIRPKKYFEDLFKNLGDMAELLLARYNGKVIAAEIVTYFDGVASYLYGASGNEHRDVMAPYLLHWEAMRRAKEKGCVKYDLLAVAPEEENSKYEIRSTKQIINNKIQNSKQIKRNHKYAGISRFKRQFGGKTIQITGGWDFVFQPMWYSIFRMAEKMRRK